MKAFLIGKILVFSAVTKAIKYLKYVLAYCAQSTKPLPFLEIVSVIHVFHLSIFCLMFKN